VKSSKLQPAPIATTNAPPLSLGLASSHPITAALRMQRIGHAAVLIQHGDDALLTDPWFSQKGGFPGYYPGESLAMGIDQLPTLSGVVTSQDHYDHFDVETFRTYRDPSVPMIVVADTPQADAARAEGFSDVRALAAWRTSQLGPFRVTAIPAKLGLAPTSFEYEHAYVIEIDGRAVLFCSHLMTEEAQSEVARQFPAFDVAFLGINGFRVRPQLNHKLSMDPKDAAELCARLSVRVAVPIHYTFHGGWLSRNVLFAHKGTPEELTQATRTIAPRTTTITLAPGQVLDVVAPVAAETSAARQAARKAAVYEMMAKLDAGDWTAFDLFAPDFVHHNLLPGTQGTPRERAQAGMRAMRTAIPDLRIDVRSVVADGDLVAVRLIQKGTPEQPLFGMPTGRPLAISSSILFRFRGDHVVEEWIDTNMPTETPS
jgi:L-ascorbate metabolism protein UlaG (beta-lactamase superfamily)/predicted ester cyclase